jgi:hypothetical protein
VEAAASLEIVWSLSPLFSWDPFLLLSMGLFHLVTIS